MHIFKIFDLTDGMQINTYLSWVLGNPASMALISCLRMLRQAMAGHK